MGSRSVWFYERDKCNKHARGVIRHDVKLLQESAYEVVDGKDLHQTDISRIIQVNFSGIIYLEN